MVLQAAGFIVDVIAVPVYFALVCDMSPPLLLVSSLPSC